MTGGRKLLGYVRGHMHALRAGLVLALLVGALEAASTLLIGLVFDTVLVGSVSPITLPFFNSRLPFAPDGTVLLALLVGCTIAKAIAEYGQVAVTAYLGQAVVRDLRNDVFHGILHQPMDFFQRNPTGELISRVSTDVERIQTAASETLSEFLKQGAILICLLAMIFYIDWKLSLASLVLVPLAFFPTVWFGRRVRTLSRSSQQELAHMANVLYEAFSGNRIVKAFLMEGAEQRRFSTVANRLFHINLRQRMTHALSSPVMEVLGVLVVVAFLVYARTQIAAGRLSIGLFAAFIFGLVKLYDPVRRISGISNSFQQAFGASDRIFEILELPLERDSGTVQLSGFSRAIDFKGVSFSYTSGTPVLDEVSFSVRQGEIVAIVGASGAGKTTLVNLVPRFFDVSAGMVLIDDVDVRDCTLKSLRQQIAVVTQDVILFDDSVWANIAYGNPKASHDDVIQAANAALVDDFVSTLPEKYQTRIGERGLRLSGGERQRISIARALLKNAPILILDEATSSLDAASEGYVQRALQNLMEGRTTIVIAHRLSTVRRADRIIVLDEGRIQETGCHEDLIARRGVYWKLYNLQSLAITTG